MRQHERCASTNGRSRCETYNNNAHKKIVELCRAGTPHPSAEAAARMPGRMVARPGTAGGRRVDAAACHGRRRIRDPWPATGRGGPRRGARRERSRARQWFSKGWGPAMDVFVEVREAVFFPMSTYNTYPLTLFFLSSPKYRYLLFAAPSPPSRTI